MITIVDYKAGNLTSVKRALDHLGIPNQISADPEVVRNAERVIFPGVGAAGTTFLPCSSTPRKAARWGCNCLKILQSGKCKGAACYPSELSPASMCATANWPRASNL